MTDEPEDSEILVGKWDCPYGHPGQDGEAMACAGCGAPRPEDVEFYLPSDARVVTDPSRIAAAKAGSDLICDSCGSSVAAGQTSCPQCSAPLDENRRQKVTEYTSREAAPSESPRTQRQREEAAPKRTASRPASNAADPDRINRALTVHMLLLALLAIGAMIGIWWLVTPHPTKLTVTTVSWERTINIEEERTVHEEDWTVPPGGRETGSYQAIHHYGSRKIGERPVRCHPQGDREKVGVRHFTCHPGGHRERTGTRHFRCHSGHRMQTGTRRYACGTTNLGNGRFRQNYCSEPTYSTMPCTHDCSEDTYTTRSCTHDCQENQYGYVSCKHPCTEDIMEPFPVYALKHTYDIERWSDLRMDRAGAFDTDPKWPTPDLSPRQREKARSETRRVTFTDQKGRSYQLADPPLEYWKGLKKGMQCSALVTATGTLTANPVCH
ncbi:MAG: hypothetical protein IT406_00840 [Candidatus Yanofskybacteria bacterium]|nr:hypothetical protein [Candidatus Yanofskybacteria bacterium]